MPKQVLKPLLAIHVVMRELSQPQRNERGLSLSKQDGNKSLHIRVPLVQQVVDEIRFPYNTSAFTRLLPAFDPLQIDLRANQEDEIGGLDLPLDPLGPA